MPNAKLSLKFENDIVNLLANYAPVLIWIADTTSECVYFNKFWLDFTGRKLEQELGNGWAEGVHPEDLADCLEIYLNHFKERKPFVAEYRLCRHDGEYRWLRDNGVPLFDNENNFKGYIGTCIDITEQRDQQIQLLQASKMSSLGEMAAGIAHEINNPLTVVNGSIFQILNEIKKENPSIESIQKNAERIEKNSNRISKIIRGLRMFARSDVADPMSRTSIKQIVEDSLELCTEKFKHSPVSLKVDDIPDVQFTCYPAQVAQVILNLLGNALDEAIKYEEKWVNLKVETTSGFIKIKIIDSGKGIDPKIVSKIMSPFYTTKASGKGTGLGLSISKKIADIHHGQLYVDHSNPNTCFVLELPLT